MTPTSTRSEKEENSNLDVEVKAAYEPRGPSDRRLSRFLWHGGTGSISTSFYYPLEIFTQVELHEIQKKRTVKENKTKR